MPEKLRATHSPNNEVDGTISLHGLNTVCPHCDRTQALPSHHSKAIKRLINFSRLLKEEFNTTHINCRYVHSCPFCYRMMVVTELDIVEIY